MHRRIALFASCALAVPPAAFADAAGRVDFSAGRVEVRSTDGQVRPLARGDQVSVGDSISTGAGRAQIRFADGAFVSLAPDTEFGIRAYAWDGRTDGSERGWFTLLKGAMRTVTGLIGRVNRQNYELRTPTATVGIRGTGGLIVVNADSSTRVTGTSGIWVLSNEAGSIDVPAGTSGLAGPGGTAPPQRVAQPAAMPPAAIGTLPLLPQLPQYAEGDNRTPSGFPASVQLPPDAGGSGGGTAGGSTGGGSAGGVGGGNGSAGGGNGGGNGGGGNGGSGENGGGGPGPGQPTTVLYAYGYRGMGSAAGPTRMARGSATADQVTATIGGNCTTEAACQRVIGFSDATLPDEARTVVHVASAGEFGTDGPVSWGRWQGAARIGGAAVSFSSNEGLHYVSGLPTPNVSPALGAATYSLIGATAPTLNGATIGPGTFSGTLRADFVLGRVGIDARVTINPETAFALATARGIESPGAPPVTIDAAQASFGGSFVIGGSGCASRPCAAAVQGGFFGAAASHAGMTYQITAPAGVVSGAAAFRR